ncbi:FAR-17a/AIG1-like protein [Cytidiella melzeri]|nr:FAR-17a/AIG1-like protein [Cytidiella melzeri]
MAGFKLGAVLLHSTATAIMTYAWLEIDNLANSAFIAKQVGGHFQYLTIQGLVAAWLTMALALITDIAPVPGSYLNLKRAVFMIAMPIAVVISSIYWTLLLLFPTLIVRAAEPGELATSSSSEVPQLLRIPLGLDLSLHAFPGIALLLDFYLLEVKYSQSHARYGAAAVATLAGTWYGWWVEYCASYNKIYFAVPYPFLTNNEFPVRVGIYAGAAILAYMFFQLLNALHS